MAKRETERTAFGARIRDARLAAGYTQEKAASLIGISQGTLAELEKQGHGSSYTPVMAHLYDKGARWLATGEGAEKPVGGPPPKPPRDFADPAVDSEWGQLRADLPFIPPAERKRLLASVHAQAEENRKHLNAMMKAAGPKAFHYDQRTPEASPKTPVDGKGEEKAS